MIYLVDETDVSFVPTSLSSNLTKTDIKTKVLAHAHERVDIWLDEVPAEVVLEMRSGIKMFPSSVRFLGIYLGY